MFDPFSLQVRQSLLALPVVAAQCIQIVVRPSAGSRIGDRPGLSFDTRSLVPHLSCPFFKLSSLALAHALLRFLLPGALLGGSGCLLVAKPCYAPVLHLRFPGLMVLESPSCTFRARMGLSVVLARMIAASTGRALIGRDPLRQRFNLASDLQHPRFFPLDPAPRLFETAAAEPLPPRFQVSMRGLQMLDSVPLRAD